MASLWIKLTIIYVLCDAVYCATLHAEHKRSVLGIDGLPSDVETIDLRMKNAIPHQDDSYICASYEMPQDEIYIVKFEALANASTAHHILLFGCSDGPAISEPTWGCPPICKSREQIMFAWAKNAPPTVLPKDVGFRVGAGSTIRNIVIQIHYAHSSPSPDHSGIRIYITRQKQKYVAGIFLMMSYSITIPPHKPVVHADVSCKYNGKTDMHPFAYRTHAHELGTVITGYQYNTTYHMIGKGNPQWPQAFYPVTENFTVKPGDTMLARCTYNSTQRETTTYIGPTGKDEMCNFYTMFYTDASVKTTYSQCGGSMFPELINQLPPDSDTRLPPNPLLDEKAGHHHQHHPQVQTPPPSTGVAMDTDLYFDKEWPTGNRIGQVSGIATDKKGNVYIFHRGSTTWKWNSFDAYNVFTQQTSSIPEKTILVYDKDGKLIRAFGENLFYMPHGLAVDDKNNVWVTDVALHQTMRFPAGKDKPDLILGEKFKPESDENHFCKPTDIAILSTGEFFVSDGYCNGRVMKFSADGKFLKQFGTQDIFATDDGEPPNGAFDIPHSITVAEDKKLVWVADRENGRIQCFDLEGKFSHIIKVPEFGSRLFAVEYSSLHDGILFAVNGPVYDGVKTVVQGFTIDIKTGKLLQSWNIPQGLNNPHDIAVNLVDHSVYIGELDKVVWRFIMAHTAGEAPVIKEYPSVDEITPNNLNGDKPKSSSTPSIVIGVLLVVPVILVIVITVLVRLYHTGKFGKKKGNKVFNIQNFFNSHKGFDRLSTEESDHEVDVYDDSDQEEYTAPTKSKA